jgi:hypothetical protein
MAATAVQNMAFVSRKGSIDPSNTPNDGEISLSRQQLDTAQYVADMILELRNMAKSAKLHAVMVPLEYAYYEAFSAANRVHVPPAEVERINRLSKNVDELDAKETEDY